MAKGREKVSWGFEPSQPLGITSGLRERERERGRERERERTPTETERQTHIRTHKRVLKILRKRYHKCSRKRKLTWRERETERERNAYKDS